MQTFLLRNHFLYFFLFNFLNYLSGKCLKFVIETIEKNLHSVETQQLRKFRIFRGICSGLLTQLQAELRRNRASLCLRVFWLDKWMVCSCLFHQRLMNVKQDFYIKKKIVCFNKKKIIAKNVRRQSGMDKSDDCFRRQEITDFFRSRNASRHEIFAGSSETTSKILLRSRENVVKIRQVNTLLCYQIPKDMK